MLARATIAMPACTDFVVEGTIDLLDLVSFRDIIICGAGV